MFKASLAFWAIAVLSFLQVFPVFGQNTQLIVSNPINATQCEFTNITWIGGTPPFTVTVYPIDGLGVSTQKLPPQQNRSVQWFVDLNAGDKFFVLVQDSDGVANSSFGVSIAGSDNQCLASPSPSFMKTSRGKAIVASVVVVLFIIILALIGCIIYLRRHDLRHRGRSIRRLRRPRNLNPFKKLNLVHFVKRRGHSITPFPSSTEMTVASPSTAQTQRSPMSATAAAAAAQHRSLPPLPPSSARTSFDGTGLLLQKVYIEQQIQTLQNEISELSRALSSNVSPPSSGAGYQYGSEKDLLQLVEQAKGELRTLEEQRQSLGPVRFSEEAPPRYDEGSHSHEDI